MGIDADQRANHLKKLDFARIQSVVYPYSIRITSVHTFWHFPGQLPVGLAAERVVISTRRQSDPRHLLAPAPVRV
jgi:hypothetical protein